MFKLFEIISGSWVRNATYWCWFKEKAGKLGGYIKLHMDFRRKTTHLSAFTGVQYQNLNKIAPGLYTLSQSTGVPSDPVRLTLTNCSNKNKTLRYFFWARNWALSTVMFEFLMHKRPHTCCNSNTQHYVSIMFYEKIHYWKWLEFSVFQYCGK